MKTAKKMSRNSSRKVAYAAKADKSSRNEHAISEPIVGRLVTEEVVSINTETGERKITHKLENPKIVHDEKISSAVKSGAALSEDPRKRRRQEAAWARCNGHHGVINCFSCGAPIALANGAK